jgi:hypothetical protein
VPIIVTRKMPTLDEPPEDAPRYRTTNRRGRCEWRIDEARVDGVANVEALKGAQLVIHFDMDERALPYVDGGRFAAPDSGADFQLDMDFARETMRVFLVAPAMPEVPETLLHATVVITTRCAPGRVA